MGKFCDFGESQYSLFESLEWDSEKSEKRAHDANIKSCSECASATEEFECHPVGSRVLWLVVGRT